MFLFCFSVHFCSQGYTPLMWACAHDQVDIVEFLLRFGADASKVSIEGECALSFASSNGNVDVLRLLLAENVDVNNYDWVSLLYSCIYWIVPFKETTSDPLWKHCKQAYMQLVGSPNELDIR